MKVKIMKQVFAGAALMTLLLTACSKDEDLPVKPSISEVEIGADNSKIAYAGSDLHIDANVSAAGNIANIHVEIHPESGAGWSYDSVYTEGFQGMKNADFHKHIDIPESTGPGHYHLHITVTDERGQQAILEDEIEIKTDPTLPVVTGLIVAVENGGSELHLEAEIAAPNKIASVEVEIHGPWEQEFSYTDAAMVGQTAYTFHKHIDIAAAPAGHYHVHLKVIDQAGKEREFEDHFDK